MIPSYFEIEILAIRDEFVTSGHKELNAFNNPTLYFINSILRQFL